MHTSSHPRRLTYVFVHIGYVGGGGNLQGRLLLQHYIIVDYTTLEKLNILNVINSACRLHVTYRYVANSYPDLRTSGDK
jgi:hypothetical protein